MTAAISVRSYRIALGCLFTIWAILWIVAFPHIYGWFTDDIDIFGHFYADYAPIQFIDAPFFHAYYWLIGGPMTLLHLHMPSYPVPLAGAQNGTEIWRSDIAITMLLHGVLLGLSALFVTKVLGRTVPALAALVLFAISPTFTFYTPLLDSRYLGLLLWIPGMLILFRMQSREYTFGRACLLAFCAGLCLSIGQDIHYTTAYVGLPFTVCFWALLGLEWRWSRRWFAALLVFGFGAAIYWGFIELVHQIMLHHGALKLDPIRILFEQRDRHMSPTDLRGNLEIWKGIFSGEMGWPMMLLALAGLAVAFRLPRGTTAAFRGHVVAATAFFGSLFLFVSPTMPFYRQVSGLQLFYAILVAMTAAYAASFLRARWRVPVIIAACLIAGALPAARSAEVYQAHQGFGRAVAYAMQRAGPKRTYFLQEKYMEIPMSLPNLGSGGSALAALPPNSMLVTDFPVFDGDPFMLAIMHDTKPLVRFPTEWCTHEQYAQLQAFFGFEKFQDERERCEARVYAVSDILAQLRRPVLPPLHVWSGSGYIAVYPPANIFRHATPLWVSNDVRTNEPFVEVDFSKNVALDSATIVAPDMHYGGGRIKEIGISGSASEKGALAPLWRGRNLSDLSVFTAHFTRQTLRRVRFTVYAQDGRTSTLSGAIKQIVFPEYRVDIRTGALREFSGGVGKFEGWKPWLRLHSLPASPDKTDPTSPNCCSAKATALSE